MSKILFTLLIISLCLCLCGCGFFSVLNEMHEDYTSTMEAEAQNYVKGEKNVTNALGESYTVKYEEHFGFPDQLMAVDISNNRALIHLDCELKRGLVPSELVYLFSDNSIEYYYAAGNYFGRTREQFHFIFTADNLSQKGEELFFDERTDLSELAHNDNSKLAETLRRNITRTELMEKFRACGYDDTFILKVYDFKSNFEADSP